MLVTEVFNSTITQVLHAIQVPSHLFEESLNHAGRHHAERLPARSLGESTDELLYRPYWYLVWCTLVKHGTKHDMSLYRFLEASTVGADSGEIL